MSDMVDIGYCRWLGFFRSVQGVSDTMQKEVTEQK